MAGSEHIFSLIFGILGNITSLTVYLAPIPTFYRIYRSRSIQGFQSLPYNTSLFSSMIWLYYAHLKSNSVLLITINAFGCFIESAYIIVYLIYATRKARMVTIQIFVLLNVVTMAVIVMLTELLFTAENRVTILGWICVIFSIIVYAAPLSIIRLVIRTHSVEFMPFNLSLFLTVSATIWFCYGVFTQDIYIEVPTVLGFLFGVAQMSLYIFYKRKSSRAAPADQEQTANGAAEPTATPGSSDSPVVAENGDRHEDGALSGVLQLAAAVPVGIIHIAQHTAKIAEHIVKIAELTPSPASELEFVAEENDDDRDGQANENGDAAEPAAAVPEHIGNIAGHIAKIAEHIVKITEPTPTPAAPESPVVDDEAAEEDDEDCKDAGPAPTPASTSRAVVVEENDHKMPGEAAVPEHIGKIAEHIAKIAEHIVKISEPTPAPASEMRVENDDKE